MTLEELNAHIADGSIDDVILVAEARQCKALGRIADDVCSRDGRDVILLAGGSSSGKTTTAKRICTQLRVNDREVVYLSTDDYFVEDKFKPKDENGEYDYEHVKCVDSVGLANDVNALLAGEEIRERRFDFVARKPMYTKRRIKLPKGGAILLEGIHALNPQLTEGIDDGRKYRIHIDPKPSIDFFVNTFASSQDVRFIRRMVRDNRYRHTSPVDTVNRWPSVLKGEKRWIEPFVGNADAEFDSFLVYEFAILKSFAGGLLERARRELGERPEIMNAICMLEAVTAIGPQKVPGDSILRETIGGSQLEY